MADLRAAAQAVIEQLKRGWVSESDPVANDLRAALAQEEQEPYCYIYEYDSAFGLHREFYPGPYNGKQKPDRTVPVYTHSPRREWQGLTKEEREAAINWAIDQETTQYSRTVARAIEQALRSKNHE
jgi:hypothetical protein